MISILFIAIFFNLTGYGHKTFPFREMEFRSAGSIDRFNLVQYVVKPSPDSGLQGCFRSNPLPSSRNKGWSVGLCSSGQSYIFCFWMFKCIVDQFLITWTGLIPRFPSDCWYSFRSSDHIQWPRLIDIAENSFLIAAAGRILQHMTGSCLISPCLLRDRHIHQFVDY